MNDEYGVPFIVHRSYFIIHGSYFIVLPPRPASPVGGCELRFRRIFKLAAL